MSTFATGVREEGTNAGLAVAARRGRRLLLLVLLYGVALIVRRRVLSRNGGTFELSHRVRPARAGRGWLLGLGRYSGEELEWFRIFSLSPRPKRVWQRSTLRSSGRREPEGVEQMSLYPDHVVIRCTTPTGEVELAMSPSSLMGFQSWLEVGPARHGLDPPLTLSPPLSGPLSVRRSDGRPPTAAAPGGWPRTSRAGRPRRGCP